MNTCQLLSAEVWHVANSKIRTKAVDKTLKTFINESKSIRIHEKSRNFTETGIFHGRRPISRKMSRPWNRELGWSLVIWLVQRHLSYQFHTMPIVIFVEIDVSRAEIPIETRSSSREFKFSTPEFFFRKLTSPVAWSLKTGF